MISIVPLDDDFGDWATPKDSTAGHFFSPFEYSRSYRMPMENLPPLDEGLVDPVPLPLFTHWYNEAVLAGLPEPNAMTLATAQPDGTPSARIVLLRGFDERGFEFFTNYQ